MYCIHVLLALVTSSWTASVRAAPYPTSHLHPRQNNGGGGGGGGGPGGNPASIQPAIWIPLVVIASLFVVGTAVACGGRRLRTSTLLNWGAGAAQAAGATTGTTVALTADQLAGSDSNTAAAATGGQNGTAGRARRPRRTRRTPSQISTHSLPAYMKEPGEQEIVIVRGADELEDEIPITVEMPPLDEHESETPRGSFDMTRPSSMYTPLPHTANNVPLLHNNESDMQHLSPNHPALATRASFDSINSSAENSSQQHYTDEAPPYEAIVLNDPPTAAPVSTSPTSPPPTHTRTSTEQSGRRRSMFASIFNPRASRVSTAPVAHVSPAASPEPRSSSGHTREGSGPSIVSVQGDQRRSRILRHHPSQSGSGSMFSLLSRTRSGQNLNGADGLTSPSMISLHSISSPLSHTLMKTEFTYPKGGPTPDQLKLISSRESFARFGRPYGPDAIAYAASASRAELEPPPGFEEVDSGAGTSSSPQPRVDTPSSGSGSNGEHAGEDEHPAEANNSSSSEHSQIAVIEPRVLPDVAEVESPTSLASPSVPVPSPASANAAVSSSSTPPSSSDVDAASSPEPQSKPQPQAVPAPSQSPRPASSTSASPPPQLSPPAPVSKSFTTATASNAPPSAFKGPTTTPTPTGGSFPSRAASRASSYMSYATAEESPSSPTALDSQYDLSGYESAVETPVVTAPPTPRMGARHVQEETDATITPGRA
ncbi:hypothetical protein C8Q74DRAFT_1280239 [Fomes fomentarius]|nr:hypothetical protein C8Q74DRAFT_1280239 [Fomes fomentarius]